MTGELSRRDPQVEDYPRAEAWTFQPAEPFRYERDPRIPADAPTIAELGPFIDWPAFWRRDHSEQEWVVDRVLAKGRGHAIYATKKTGKSLLILALLLDMLAKLLEVIVIYLDWEMTEDDLYERLLEMGYDDESDLSRLRYWQLPDVGPLDTQRGAEEVLEIIDAERALWPGYHVVVVIDTTGRAVTGGENDSDTFRAFYRHTGIQLKMRQITYARLDHAGHDTSRQRGSSAKGEDVDVIWRLEPADRGGYTLRRDAARMAWVPERVSLERRYSPLRFVLGLESWPEGTAELAKLLDELEVPLDATVKAARDELKAAGQKARQSTLAAAVKWRKRTFLGSGNASGNAFLSPDGIAGGNDLENRQGQGVTGSVTRGNDVGGNRVTTHPSIEGCRDPNRYPDELDEDPMIWDSNEPF